MCHKDNGTIMKECYGQEQEERLTINYVTLMIQQLPTDNRQIEEHFDFEFSFYHGIQMWTYE